MSARPSVLLAAATLWRREMVRFFRQRSRVIGSLLTPLLFWFLFSAGYRSFFQSDSTGGGSFAYFLPGTITLILLFTSIFANISIIEDRKEGFLQGVLVAPVSRGAIVLGKVVGGATIALVQGIAFLLLGLGGGVGITLTDPGATLAAILLLSLGITAFGFCFAWSLDSVQGFHGVMNLLLMPMWLLSGALFPLAGTPGVLRAIMLANPVTYGLAAVRHGLGIGTSDLPGPATSLLVLGAFAILTLIGASILASRPSSPRS